MESFSIIKIAKENLEQIPSNIKRFLFRGLSLFIVWKILYHLILYPKRIPDEYFTKFTAILTGKLYSTFFNEVQPHFISDENRTVIFFGLKRGIGIGHGCNGLELFVLYIGLLFCLPLISLKKLILYSIGGTILIFVLNILRCSALCWFNINKYDWFNFAHHYVFQLIVYVCIFLLWKMYLSANEKK